MWHSLERPENIMSEARPSIGTIGDLNRCMLEDLLPTESLPC